LLTVIVHICQVIVSCFFFKRQFYTRKSWLMCICPLHFSPGDSAYRTNHQAFLRGQEAYHTRVHQGDTTGDSGSDGGNYSRRDTGKCRTGRWKWVLGGVQGTFLMSMCVNMLLHGY